jgi:hypothetical protein
MHWLDEHFRGVAVVWIALIVIGVLWWTQAEHPPREKPRVWQCCRYQGGANVYTPRPMTEEQALHFAAALGSVLWVDRQHAFIFYRPAGGL